MLLLPWTGLALERKNQAQKMLKTICPSTRPKKVKCMTCEGKKPIRATYFRNCHEEPKKPKTNNRNSQNSRKTHQKALPQKFRRERPGVCAAKHFLPFLFSFRSELEERPTMGDPELRRRVQEEVERLTGNGAL